MPGISKQTPAAEASGASVNLSDCQIQGANGPISEYFSTTPLYTEEFWAADTFGFRQSAVMLTQSGAKAWRAVVALIR